jgi:uncharacterized protein (DUF2141 family)
VTLRVFLRASTLFILSLCFFLACAKIEAPPGGPVDKTGPSIISVYPLNGSTLIPRDNRITIQFSESVDRKSAEGAVFVSPRSPGEIVYKWRGKILDLILADSFAVNATYVVNVGSGLKDLRNNKMERSYTFSFSTGDRIAAGVVSGMIFQNKKPAANIAVGLFDAATTALRPRLDSVYPEYLTYSSDIGQYKLEYLPDGRRFLFAFSDKNGNRLFDYPDEDFGIPASTPNIREGRPLELNVILQKEIADSLSIIGASMTADRLIKVRFSRPIENALILDNLDKIYLTSIDTPNVTINPTAAQEGSDGASNIFHFLFDWRPKGLYKLSIPKILRPVDEPAVETPRYSSAMTESAPFEISDAEDKTPPVIISVSHNGRTVFPDENKIQISFSEPLNRNIAGDSAVRLYDSGEDEIATTSYWVDEFKLVISPETLSWGTSYSLIARKRYLYDLTGNGGEDTIQIYSFKTYNLDSLGSVSGGVYLTAVTDSLSDEKSPAPRLWEDDDIESIPQKIVYLEFAPMPSGLSLTRKTALGSRFDFALPPGRYLLSGFIDKNHNDKFDPGKLNPLEFSEPFAVYPDTIRVRSRFETSDINLFFAR